MIAMHMATVDLPAPAVAHFDLAIPGGCPVTDDEMIGQPILHMPDMAMVVIEDLCVPLARPAVMHHDEFPPWIAAIGRRPIDFRANSAGEITKPRSTSGGTLASIAMEKTIPKARALLVPGFLNG